MYMAAKTTIKAHKRRVYNSHKKPRSSKHHKITVRKLGKHGKRTRRKRMRGGMGRPKGSKNKPKPPAAGDAPEPVPSITANKSDSDSEAESITLGEKLEQLEHLYKYSDESREEIKEDLEGYTNRTREGRKRIKSVSYTHLTLPTILRV